VMTPATSLDIIRSGHVEMMQLPTSVLDSRFMRGGVLDEGAQRGMGMFVRSIYLQGLLLMPEEDVMPELREVVPVRRKLSALASEAGITLTELAVRYLLGDSRITCLVVGVDTVDQMKENAALFAKGSLETGLASAINEAVPDLPESILAPTNWPRKMTTTLKTGK
jgi:aryl-alcohol dehydrogenase-like predicted oxidoreductase